MLLDQSLLYLKHLYKLNIHCACRYFSDILPLLTINLIKLVDIRPFHYTYIHRSFIFRMLENC